MTAQGLGIPAGPLGTLFGAIPISPQLRAVSDDLPFLSHHPAVTPPSPQYVVTTLSPLKTQDSLFGSFLYLTHPIAVWLDFLVTPQHRVLVLLCPPGVCAAFPYVVTTLSSAPTLCSES